MGPAHCTSGATYCSEISSTLAWGRKVPSVRGVPREGSTRVFSVERLCTSREDLRTLLPFRPRAIWRLRLKARARSRSYTLLYSTCSTSRITQACVFTPHLTICLCPHIPYIPKSFGSHLFCVNIRALLSASIMGCQIRMTGH